MQAGYVRGGRSRRLRPILQPANAVLGEWRARTEDQLGGLTVELIHSLAPLHAEPLAAAALDWVTALTAAALPEGQAYPRLYAALTGVIGAVEAAPGGARLGGGAGALRIAAAGRTRLRARPQRVRGDRRVPKTLAFVSPKSASAVSRAAATGYEARLLALPPFLLGAVAPDWPDILAGLRLTGHFLARDILTERRAEVLDARARLVERLTRAVA